MAHERKISELIKVDPEDQYLLDNHYWGVTYDGYAKRYVEKLVDGKRKRWVYHLHREVIGAKKGEIVDHINGDRLDNRRSNLRIASKSLNALNSPKNKGFYFRNQNKKWHARIKFNKIEKHLGFFDTPEAASAAYQKAKKEILSVV